VRFIYRRVPRVRAVAWSLALLGLLWVQGLASSGLTGADRRIAAEGQPAPDFALADLEGRKFRLSDLRGEVVLVHFWATWCVHCVGEMKILQQAVGNTDRKPPRILAVNLGEPASRVREFARAKGLAYPILLDRRGKVAEAYGVVGLPATLVVSADGRVVRRLEMGALSAETLKTIVESPEPEPR
jgi:peroxiredoxin